MPFFLSPVLLFSPWTQRTQRQARNPVFSTGDRDGDRHPESRLRLHLPPSSPRSRCVNPPLASGSPASPARIGEGEEREMAKYNPGTHRPRPCPTCVHTRLASQAWTAAPRGWGDSLAWLG